MYPMERERERETFISVIHKDVEPKLVICNISTYVVNSFWREVSQCDVSSGSGNLDQLYLALSHQPFIVHLEQDHQSKTVPNYH